MILTDFGYKKRKLAAIFDHRIDFMSARSLDDVNLWISSHKRNNLVLPEADCEVIFRLIVAVPLNEHYTTKLVEQALGEVMNTMQDYRSKQLTTG